MNLHFHSTSEYEPKTQKAIGVSRLGLICTFGRVTSPTTICLSATDKATNRQLPFPSFVRPCPIKPRHGFVDSRVCSNKAEYEDIRQEVLAEDPEGELLIMPAIPSYHSAVLAGTNLSIGRGNAGVTGGEKALVLPLVNSGNLQRMNRLAVENSVIQKGETALYEFVYGTVDFAAGPICYLVQARSAPTDSVIDSCDYIPETVVVTKVLMPEGMDLLDWEKQIATIDPKSGTVVYLPGASLSSHYAMHATTHKIPVITREHKPVIGSTLVKATESVTCSAEDVIKGFYRGVAYTPGSGEFFSSELKAVGKTILALVHNSVPLSTKGKGTELGIAAGLLASITLSLGAGEARYFQGGSGDANGGRKTYYKKILSSDRTTYPATAIEIHNKFVDYDSWSGSYGGTKWAAIVRAGIDVWNAALAGDVDELVRKMNSAIHLQHNSSWFMDKILEGKGDYNLAVSDPAEYVVANAEYIYETLTTIQAMDTTTIPALTEIDIDGLLGPYHSGWAGKVESEEEESESEESPACTCEYCNPPKEKVIPVKAQLRWVQESGSYRVQIFLSGGKFIESQVYNDQFTTQTGDLVKQAEHTEPSAVQGSDKKYIKLDMMGKQSLWYSIAGKRIIQVDKLHNLMGVA